MKFLKTLFGAASDVVVDVADTVTTTTQSANRYAEVLLASATESALEASDELANKYGGQDELLTRVAQHDTLIGTLKKKR